MTSKSLYIDQAILEEKYKCYGYFYSIVLHDHKFPCRSVLEIVDKTKIPHQTDDLLKQIPDLVVIMMNPGASRPKIDQSIEVQLDSIKDMKISLTTTIPDRTQYQIMRIMEAKNWTHSRILNLSDLRDPKSGKFYKYFELVESILGSDHHTIFSKLREKELYKKLNSKSPILAAWGVSDKLDPLINKCMNNINNENLIGIRKSGSLYKYYHPLLQGTPFNQKEWLNKLYIILQNTFS